MDYREQETRLHEITLPLANNPACPTPNLNFPLERAAQEDICCSLVAWINLPVSSVVVARRRCLDRGVPNFRHRPVTPWMPEVRNALRIFVSYRR